MSALAKTTRQRAELLTASHAGDAPTVQRLLRAGLDPAAAFKTKTAFHVALASGEESLVQPFVEAFLRKRRTSQHNLSAIACRVFKDDRFPAAFAETLIAFVNYGLEGERAQRNWDVALSNGLAQFHDRIFDKPLRQDEVLAAKVALAVADGWRPGEAWRDGWLPHHEYLHRGWLEAALACVVGGAKPDEPTRRFGIRSPESVFSIAWRGFQARLRAHRAGQVFVTIPFKPRTRQRA